MTTVDIDTLRGRASRASETARASDERRRADYVAGLTLRAETDSAVLTMLYAARLREVVLGFPDFIDLASHNGYMAGYGLAFREGSWRLVIPSDGYSVPPRIDDHLDGMPAKAMVAMKIPHSPEAYATVKSVAQWDVSQFGQDFEAARRLLPAHTALALYGVGLPLARLVGFEDVGAAAKAFAVSAKANAVDFSSKPTPDRPSLIVRLSTRYNARFLMEAVEVCGARVDKECLFTAVGDMGPHLAARLIRMGVSAASQDSVGESALHIAARSAFSRHGAFSALEMIGTLVKAGVPLGLRNCHGNTAEALFADYLGDREREDSVDEADRRYFDAIGELLSSA